MTSAVLGAETSARVVAQASSAAESTVRFDAVTVAYRGAIVLKPLTLDVAAGEVLASAAEGWADDTGATFPDPRSLKPYAPTRSSSRRHPTRS